jgi:hypothetical protein
MDPEIAAISLNPPMKRRKRSRSGSLNQLLVDFEDWPK